MSLTGHQMAKTTADERGAPRAAGCRNRTDPPLPLHQKRFCVCSQAPHPRSVHSSTSWPVLWSGLRVCDDGTSLCLEGVGLLREPRPLKDATLSNAVCGFYLKGSGWSGAVSQTGS